MLILVSMYILYTHIFDIIVDISQLFDVFLKYIMLSERNT